MIKRNKAAKVTKLSRYPRTFDACWNAIPKMLKEELTSKQLAKVMETMYASQNMGHSEGFTDARS